MAPQEQAPRTDGQAERGRAARWPSDIPAAGWKDIAWRVWSECAEDRVLLVAAGATFYLLLALFPALAAFVSLYGLVADPATVADQISSLGGLLPPAGLELIRQQLESLAQGNDRSLGLSFVVGLLIALWSANGGIKALFEATNIAHDETEKRSFVRLNLLALAFTMGAILVAAALLLAVGIVPAALAFLQLGAFSELLISLLRWPILILILLTGIALLYRFGPSRAHPKWRWLSWGAVLAAVVWILASWAFSFYLQRFADYNATYGSLGAIVGLMTWTWISLIVLIVGAEINAEMEHQTAEDTTTGPDEPMGERGAVMADTLGRSVEGD